jgi:HAMP domain-containing protein
MFGLFGVLVVVGVLSAWVCLMGAAAWVLERLIIWYERRNRHA